MRLHRITCPVLLAGCALIVSCARHDDPVAPAPSARYTLRGHVQLTGYLVDAQGNFAGTRIVDDASGVRVELLAGAGVASRTLTVAGEYTFSGLLPGAYQTRCRVLDGIGDVSRVFTIVGSNLEAGDTLRVVAQGDLYPVPNPFDSSTTLSFALPETEHVEVRIATLAVEDSVVTLIDGIRPKGVREAWWNGRDRVGNPVPAGIYWAFFVSGIDQRAQLLFKSASPHPARAGAPGAANATRAEPGLGPPRRRAARPG